MHTAWESYLYARAISAWAVRLIVFWFVLLIIATLLGGIHPAIKQGLVTLLMATTVAGGVLFLHGLVLELGIAAATPSSRAPVGLPREAILAAAKLVGVVFVGQLAASIYVYLLPLHAVWMFLPVLLASILMVLVIGRLLGWSPRPGLVGLWAMSMLLFVGITLLAVKESGYADGLVGSVRNFMPSVSAAGVEVVTSRVYQHPVQDVCPTPMEWRGSQLGVLARSECWSPTIVVPVSATEYSISNPAECWEAFYPDATGDTLVAGQRGFVQKCTDPSLNRRGIFKVRTQAAPSIVEISYQK